MQADVPVDHPLLTAAELDGWRKWMWDMYTTDAQERGRAEFITEAYVHRYVEDALPLMDALYARAFG